MLIEVAMFVVVLTTILTLLSSGSSYNLDFEFTVVKDGPPGSYFGYSVAEYNDGTDDWYDLYHYRFRLLVSIVLEYS